jgi:autotransporter-associated beta strand protein
MRLLAFVAAALAGTQSLRATVTVAKSGSTLTDTIGVNSDTSTITTTASGATIQVVGTNFLPQTFSGITGINVNFASTAQTVTFDSTNFSFMPSVTITGGAASDIVVKNGANTLTLKNSDTYGGGTSINAGAVLIGNAGALGTGMVDIFSGAELRATGNLTLANLVETNGSGASTISTNGNLTFGNFSFNGHTVIGSAGNAGTVTILGGATQAADPNHTLDIAYGTARNGGGLGLITSTMASTTVNAGATLSVNDQNMNVANLLGAGSVNLGTNAATLLFLQAATFSGVISGAGNVTTTGSVTLIGNNNYTGGTTIDSGSILQIGTGGATGSIAGNVTDNGALYFQRNNALTYAGVISGTGTVTDFGTGALTLSGTNSYSGGTTINAGVLVAGNSSALGTAGVTIKPGAELRGTSNVTLPGRVTLSGTGASTISANSSLSLNSLTVADNAIFGSAGNAGTVTILGGGGVSNLYTFEVAFGTLRNGGGLDFYTRALKSTTVDSGATLSVNDSDMTVYDLLGKGAVTLGTKATTTLTLNYAFFGGVISGAGGLAVNSTTQVFLTGTNTYTGGTTVTAGQLQIGDFGPTGSITGNIVNNALLAFGRNNAYTFKGNISGTGSVTQLGGAPTAVLTLSGNNTYTGGTFIGEGALVVPNSNSVGSGIIGISDNAELRSSGTVTLANAITTPTQGTAIISSTGTLTLSQFSFGSATHVIFGSAGNAGTVVIGNNGGGASFGFNGTTGDIITVAYGTVRNGGFLNGLTDSFDSTTVNTGATLSINDGNVTVKALRGTGAVNLGTKASTILTLEGDSFGGAISGAGELAINGSVTLTGTNTYTGGTLINADLLQIGHFGATGSIVGNVTNNSVLVFARTNAYTFGGIISGTGYVAQSAGLGPAGVLTLSGANTYTGGTFIDSGVVVATNNNSLGTGPVNMSAGTELRGSGTIKLSNEIKFPDFLPATISSTGTLTLSDLHLADSQHVVFGSPGNAGTVVIGNNGLGTTYITTGTTITVAYGTLLNGGLLYAYTPNAASTTVNAGATLNLNDSSIQVYNLLGAGAVTLGTHAGTTLLLGSANFGGVISGAGQVTIAGPVTFTGTNTYTGGTTINNGATLEIGNGLATGLIAGAVTDDGGLIFHRNNAFIFSGAISGAGTVTKSGTGDLTLNGSNTYTGGTTVSNGTLIASANSLGTGPVIVKAGTELRGSGIVTISSQVALTGIADTLSSTGTLTLTTVSIGNSEFVYIGNSAAKGTVTFGNAGAGSVSVGTGDILNVLYGTLRNGGTLNSVTSQFDSTGISPGATLSLNDLNLQVHNLLGAGAVTLGTSAATSLTLNGATYGGVISGAGHLFANSTVTLTGVNTYTGGTTINSGATLQIGNGGTTGSLAGAVVDNGSLVFNQTGALTFSGAISGTGSVTQAGTGALTLSGMNTYSGGTILTAGTLVFGTAGALGSNEVVLFPGTELRASGNIMLPNSLGVASGSVATVSSKGTLGLSSFLFGAGNINLVFGSPGNAGVVEFETPTSAFDSNDNTFTVAYGTLRNNGGLSLFTSYIASTTVKAGATLSVNDQSMAVNNLLGAGAVNLGTKSPTALTLSGATFTGVISGAGKLTTAGAVTLSGSSTYSGGTTISSGTTLVNNTSGSGLGTGPVTVNNGAILGGRGAIGGAVTLNSGSVIEPGAALPGIAGTKLHASSLIFNGGGTLEFQIGATTDQILLSGALTKGTAGAFTLYIFDDGIVSGNYTLMTFASTTFSLSDFNVVFPVNYTGTLVETSTSLSIQNLHDPPPGPGEMPLAADEGGTLAMSDPINAGAEPATINDGSRSTAAPGESEPIVPPPVPEPGSGLLLAMGGSALLGWRRRRVAG